MSLFFYVFFRHVEKNKKYFDFLLTSKYIVIIIELYFGFLVNNYKEATSMGG